MSCMEAPSPVFGLWRPVGILERVRETLENDTPRRERAFTRTHCIIASATRSVGGGGLFLTTQWAPASYLGKHSHSQDPVM